MFFIAMQNGGLSSILNPYSLLAGAGGLTSGSTTGPTSANSLLKGNNPYATQLNRSQISSLWSNGPASGLLGSIPRGKLWLLNWFHEKKSRPNYCLLL